VVDWSLAATGMGVGLAVAAPIGPVNIMCIHRSVRRGFFYGLAAGAGGLLADTVCAAIVAYGVSAIAIFVEGHIGVLKSLGGVLLLGFGLSVALKRPHAEVGADDDSALSMVGATAASFVLAMTNPALLLGFLAMFGGIGKIAEHRISLADAGILVAGVAAGSALWWVILSAAASHWRDRLSDRWFYRINLVMGGGLALFGVGVLIDVARRWIV
jgi:threonine/homoserine/homoserine lactone efflux protein